MKLDIIKKESNILYQEIDECITELLQARTSHDTEAEGKALFKMEGLMVGIQQHLSCIMEAEDIPLPSSFEEARDMANFEESYSLNAYMYEKGFKDGAEWIEGQGSSFECEVCETPQGQWAAGLHLCDCADKEQSALKKIGAKDYDKVIVQIRRK